MPPSLRDSDLRPNSSASRIHCILDVGGRSLRVFSYNGIHMCLVYINHIFDSCFSSTKLRSPQRIFNRIRIAIIFTNLHFHVIDKRGRSLRSTWSSTGIRARHVYRDNWTFDSKVNGLEMNFQKRDIYRASRSRDVDFLDSAVRLEYSICN